MLIISKQHDYYDSVGKTTGIDKTIVYRREEKQYFNDDKEMQPHLNAVGDFPCGVNRSYDTIKTDTVIGYAAGSVGFCGATYPVLQVCYHIDPSNARTVHYYGAEAADRINEVEEQTVGDKILMSLPWNRGRTERWLQFRFSAEDFQRWGSPVLSLVRRDDPSYSPIFTVDPVLKDLGFQKVVDPYTAFQEIQMYLSGVLGNTEKETVTISDTHRLEAAGFDKKWSFRKQSK